MSSKISPFKYLRDHRKSLYNANSGKPGLDDYFWFLIVPIVVAFVLWLSGARIPQESIKVIIGALAIFVGLIFASLLNLVTLDRQFKDQEKPSTRDKNQNITIRELTANILFCIFIAFISVPLMLLLFVESIPVVILGFINAIVFFILIEFTVTFLMVLKRVYIIFTYK